MAHQAPISAARLQRWVGRRVRVLIDAMDEEAGCLIARGPGDAPDIDGIVRIWPNPSSRHAMPVRLGEWAEVDIVESDAYDLEAIWVASGPTAEQRHTQLIET